MDMIVQILYQKIAAFTIVILNFLTNCRLPSYPAVSISPKV